MFNVQCLILSYCVDCNRWHIITRLTWTRFRSVGWWQSLFATVTSPDMSDENTSVSYSTAVAESFAVVALWFHTRWCTFVAIINSNLIENVFSECRFSKCCRVKCFCVRITKTRFGKKNIELKKTTKCAIPKLTCDMAADSLERIGWADQHPHLVAIRSHDIPFHINENNTRNSKNYW